MQCESYLPLLSGHIDQTNTDEEEALLQAHLAQCAHCRELLKQMEQADALLADIPSVPPDDLTQRIMRQIRAEAKKRHHTGRIFGILAAGVAAAAMLVFVFSGSFPMPFASSDKKVDTAAIAAPEAATNVLMDVAVSDAGEKAAFSGEDIPTYGFDETYADFSAETNAGLSAKIAEKSSDTNAFTGKHPAACLPPFAALGTDDAPSLTIWNATASDFEQLDDLSPIATDCKTVSSFLYSGATNDWFSSMSTLLARYSRGETTMARKPTLCTVTYRVSYALMTELLSDCIGIYETSVYYPARVDEDSLCTLTIVGVQNSIVAVPQF